MDNKEAKKNLQELKESLEKVLGDDGLQEEAQEHAKAAKQGAKTLIGRLKELPVVEKISSLGTAGTVAVGTAAATQAELAVNYTEIVVAQVAEDVYEGIIEPPFLFDMIDYESLHIWGRKLLLRRSLRSPNYNRLLNHLLRQRIPNLHLPLLHKILATESLLRVNPLNRAKNQKQRSQKQKKVNHLVITKKQNQSHKKSPRKKQSKILHRNKVNQVSYLLSRLQ